MTKEIEIYTEELDFHTKSFVFPGGEVQVGIPGLPESIGGDIVVVSRLQSSDAIMRLILATEILDRTQWSGRRRLVVPYFPYARQDRVMQDAEAFSLKAVAGIINSLDYDEVVVCDPHSTVTPALVDRIKVVPQIDLIRKHHAVHDLMCHTSPVIVAPDAGASHKAWDAAVYFNRPLLTASKIRDVRTGEIRGTSIDTTGIATGWSALIVDDICDGGRTFIELAKVLRDKGAREVRLYVTHGIFSKGISVFDGLIDAIYTTDTFIPHEAIDNQSVPVFVSRLDWRTIARED